MWPLSLLEVPILQDVVQAALPAGFHPLIVDCDWDNIQSSRSGSLNSIHVGKFFAQDAFSFSEPISALIPIICEGLQCLGEGVGRTACQYDLGAAFIWDVGVKMVSGELSKEVVERWIALGCAILQSRCEVDLPEDILLV